MSLLGGETGHPGRSRTGLSCEIARIFNPSTSGVSTAHLHARWSLSHDWHVQPSFQRPKRSPPERRVPAGNPLPDARPRSSTLWQGQNIGETFSTYRAHSRTVNLESRPEIQRISTAFPQGAQRPKRSRNLRDATRSRDWHPCPFGTKAARKIHLKKDRLEVFAITRPLKPFEDLCPRI